MWWYLELRKCGRSGCGSYLEASSDAGLASQPKGLPQSGCPCCWFKDPLGQPAEWAVGFHVVVLQVQASTAFSCFSLVCPDSDPFLPRAPELELDSDRHNGGFLAMV